jgi:hypothetical protein
MTCGEIILGTAKSYCSLFFRNFQASVLSMKLISNLAALTRANDIAAERYFNNRLAMARL